MDPDRSPSKPAAETVVESIAREEGIIDKHRAAEPVRTPSPAAPTSPAIETETEVEAPSKAKSESWIIERGVEAVNRRSPNIEGIIRRHIDNLGAGWLNDDGLLTPLCLIRNRLLGRRRKPAVGLSLGSHLLDCIHHVGLLGEEGVAKVRSPANILV